MAVAPAGIARAAVGVGLDVVAAVGKARVGVGAAIPAAVGAAFDIGAVVGCVVGFDGAGVGLEAGAFVATGGALVGTDGAGVGKFGAHDTEARNSKITNANRMGNLL